MFRVSGLLFAAVVAVSTSGLAADTPDPSAKGGAAVPSGSNTNPPTSPLAGDPAVDKPNLPAPATSPGEENKNKPPIKAE